MKKFVKLSIINNDWPSRYANPNDITYYKKTILRKKCAICGNKANKEIYSYKNKETRDKYYFCSECLVKEVRIKSTDTGKIININRSLADYINFVFNKSLFTAKKVDIRKSDILSVETAFVDKSIVRFNGNTRYKGFDNILVNEKRMEVRKLLGETINPNHNHG